MKNLSNYASFAISIARSRLINQRLPIFVAFGVTSKCNYKCSYCYGDFAHSKAQDYTTEEVIKIIDDLGEMGTKVINVIGGEPLLRDDIETIINRVKQNNMACHLSTNGSLIPAKIGLLKNVDIIDTSLDGDEEANDRNRGVGTYQKTLAGIKCAREHNMTVNCNMVLTRYNLEDIDKMIVLAEELGFYLSFNLAFESHSAEYKNYEASKAIKADDDRKAREAIKKILEYKQKGYPVKFSTYAYRYALNWPFPYSDKVSLSSSELPHNFKPIKCYFGQLQCYIDADKRVYSCQHIKDKLPEINVIELGIRKAWEELQKVMVDCKACYTICNNEINALFSLTPSVVISNIKDILRF